jgi:hypothetical protein
MMRDLKTLVRTSIAIGVLAGLASAASANKQPAPINRGAPTTRTTHQVVCADYVAPPAQAKMNFALQPAGWEGGWMEPTGKNYYNFVSINAALGRNEILCFYENNFFLKLALRAGESCTTNADRKSATCTGP